MSTITQQVAGRRIAAVYRVGDCLLIKCDDGFDLTIGWKDSETGLPLKGEPVVVNAGRHIIARPSADLVHRRTVGL